MITTGGAITKIKRYEINMALVIFTDRVVLAIDLYAAKRKPLKGPGFIGSSIVGVDIDFVGMFCLGPRDSSQPQGLFNFFDNILKLPI